MDVCSTAAAAECVIIELWLFLPLTLFPAPPSVYSPSARCTAALCTVPHAHRGNAAHACPSISSFIIFLRYYCRELGRDPQRCCTWIKKKVEPRLPKTEAAPGAPAAYKPGSAIKTSSGEKFQVLLLKLPRAEPTHRTSCVLAAGSTYLHAQQTVVDIHLAVFMCSSVPQREGC